MLIFELDQGNSGINIWYKFNENPSKFIGMRALTKKCDGRIHGPTDTRTDGRQDDGQQTKCDQNTVDHLSFQLF